MCPLPFFWNLSDHDDNRDDIYNTFDPWLPQMQVNKPILSPPYIELFDEQVGIFDNITRSGLGKEFGMVEEEAQHERFSGESEQPPKHDAVSNLNSKLSHNAHERQRRKKLNGLYSRLRSLLPNPNPKRQLSIPDTVAKAVKYIPELEKEVEKLGRERDKLLSIKRTSHSRSVITSKSMHSHSHSDGDGLCSLMVTLNRAALRCLEVVITVYTCRAAVLLSSLLTMLEDEELEIQNTSTFVSGDRLYHIFHLQMMEGRKLDTEALRKKLFLFSKRNMTLDF